MIPSGSPARALALAVAFSTCVLAAACSGKDAPQAAAGTPPAVKSTAGPGVSLLGSPLDMPGLQRQRQVRIYVPPGYATSDKRYPVLYMHDGQNLFDNATAFAGEWGVDETLDALAREGRLALIVVGIDNGGTHRINELNAWKGPYTQTPEGDAYLDFIVHTVKPLVDRTYRTLPDRAHTAIMGSSMGGLISHYGITRYPEVFGKAGVFSPSYWAGPASIDYLAAHPVAADARIYLLMGDQEGDSMVPDVRRMAGLMRAAGTPEQNMTLEIVPGGAHNERMWSDALRRALLWLFEGPDAKAD